MQTADGVIGLVETGYSFPSTADEQREFSSPLASDRMYAKSGPDRIEIRDRRTSPPAPEACGLRLETDVYYPLFVRQVLAECRTGASRSPIARRRGDDAGHGCGLRVGAQGGAPQTLVLSPSDPRLPQSARVTACQGAQRGRCAPQAAPPSRRVRRTLTSDLAAHCSLNVIRLRLESGGQRSTVPSDYYRSPLSGRFANWQSAMSGRSGLPPSRLSIAATGRDSL